MKQLTKFLILAIIFFQFSANAQNAKASFFGKITDQQSGEPLIGAFVMVPGTSIGVATDYDGKYSIPSIEAGDYELEISYVGYDNKIIPISIGAGEKKKLNIELEFSGVQLGAVEITAQAKGQMSAINEQINSNQISNIVSAERIQELPDANAAETVGRISGVSVLRSGGEGNKVVIRGLSPKYNKITIEGISMSGGEGDRSSDISMVSPYSLDGIEVLKSVTADHDADFIGGSVNFKLRSADPGLKYDAVVQGGFNSLTKSINDYMLVGSLSNRFFNDKFGAYLQGNIENRNRSAHELLANYRIDYDAKLGETNKVFIKSLTLIDAMRRRARNGATLVLDYKIPEGSIHFMNIYNSGTTKILKNSEIYNIDSRVHSYKLETDNAKLATWSSIFDLEKRWGNFLISGKLSYSSTDNDRPENKKFTFNQEGALETKVQNVSIPPNDVPSFANIDNSQTYFDGFDSGSIKTSSNVKEASVNLSYDFTLTKKLSGLIKIGGKYKTQSTTHDRDIFGGDLKIGSGQSGNDAILDAFPEIAKDIPNGNRVTFPYFMDKDHTPKTFLKDEYKLGDVANADMMSDVLDVLQNDKNLSLDAYFNKERSSNTYDYHGNEKLMAAYAMAEFNIGSKIKFIPGMRFEQNHTEYTGVRGITNIAFFERSYIRRDTTFTRDNNYLFPMIHLKLSPTKWFDVRAAYTQTLSRPSYQRFTPRRDIWGDNIAFNNPNLKPEFAENWDLYLVFHQNKLGLLTLGGFTKKIDDMILNLGKRIIVNPEDYDLDEDFKGKRVYTYANNSASARVTGIEADWQFNLWFLSNFLKGIVFNFNYTHIFSETQYPYSTIKDISDNPFEPNVINVDTFFVSRLVDQPSDIVNIQIGYDLKGFSSRISMLYQSNTFKQANFWPELSPSIAEYLRFDLSLKQKLPWYNSQVFCNINNITGALDRELISGGIWDSKIQHYGTTIDFGLRFKL